MARMRSTAGHVCSAVREVVVAITHAAPRLHDRWRVHAGSVRCSSAAALTSARQICFAQEVPHQERSCARYAALAYVQ